jgi:ABC-type transport system substrate-binding protein
MFTNGWPISTLSCVHAKSPEGLRRGVQVNRRDMPHVNRHERPNVKFRAKLLVSIALALSLTASSISLVVVPLGHSDTAPLRTTDGTQWVPAGPMMDKLQIQVYSDALAEYNAMLQPSSAFDLGDSPVPASMISTFLGDSRFYLSAPNSEFGMFQIDFNHANTFFGIPDEFGNNPSGIELREAVAHLINKPAVVTDLLLGLATPTDNAVPPGQGLLCSGLGCPSNGNSPNAYSYTDTANGKVVSLTGACGWETIASLQTGCLSAFRQSAETLDSVGLVTASAFNPDFCNAAQHLVNAGLATGINAADCSVAGHHTAALDSGSIILWVRTDNEPRFTLGRDLATRLCELFNGLGVTTCTQISLTLGPLSAAEGTVYSTKSVLLDWHIYIGSWSLTPIFDQLYNLYNSAFASTACGGKAATFGQDYGYFCNSQYDAFTSMLEFNDTTSGAIASAQMAMQIFGQHVATIPLWSQALRVPYQKGWTGVNDATGLGPSNYFTWLNAWNSTPAVLGTMRQGFSSGTLNLNPFLALTPYEFRIIRAVYDSLIQTAPYDPTTPFAWLANSYTSVVADSTGKCGTGDLFPIAGSQSCLIFNLRPNVFFHDGTVVTGSDVKFSMLAFKQVPGPLSSGVSGVLDVTYQDGPVQGAQSVFVHLNSKSVFAIFSVGGEPIIPQHVWASDPTTPCPGTATGATLPASCTVNPNLATADPVVSSVCTVSTGCGAATVGTLCSTFAAGCAGLFVGNGPWTCSNLNLPGTPAGEGPTGNGCTSTATNTAGTQAVNAGGTIILQRFGLGFAGLDPLHSYFRDSAKYLMWQWADRLGHGTVDNGDLGNFAGCSGSFDTGSCAYWDVPVARATCTSSAGSCNAASLVPIGGDRNCLVDSTDQNTLSGEIGLSWASPVAYLSLMGTQLIPQTLYEGGIVYNQSLVALIACPRVVEVVNGWATSTTITAVSLFGFFGQVSLSNPTVTPVVPVGTLGPIGTLSKSTLTMASGTDNVVLTVAGPSPVNTIGLSLPILFTITVTGSSGASVGSTIVGVLVDVSGGGGRQVEQ